MLACGECAKLGHAYLEPRVPKSSYVPIRKAKPSSTALSPTRRKTKNLREETELTENFGSLVREARENLGLTHEDLGRKIGEKVSVLKKVEGEKMFPDERLATKLEYALKVKILVQREKRKVPETFFSSPSSPVTLGEIARLKTGKRRNLENEGGNSS